MCYTKGHCVCALLVESWIRVIYWDRGSSLSVPQGTLVISRRALAREGDYEMMSVRACVCACVS